MTARVLVVDDSPLGRLALARRARAEGWEVIEGDSARSAAEVDATTIACAVLDLDLGDGWGTDVAEKLRASHPSLPIAFFTSETGTPAFDRAASFGPVFAKPDDLDQAIAWMRASDGAG